MPAISLAHPYRSYGASQATDSSPATRPGALLEVAIRRGVAALVAREDSSAGVSAATGVGIVVGICCLIVLPVIWCFCCRDRGKASPSTRNSSPNRRPPRPRPVRPPPAPKPKKPPKVKPPKPPKPPKTPKPPKPQKTPKPAKQPKQPKPPKEPKAPKPKAAKAAKAAKAPKPKKASAAAPQKRGQKAAGRAAASTAQPTPPPPAPVATRPLRSIWPPLQAQAEPPPPPPPADPPARESVAARIRRFVPTPGPVIDFSRPPPANVHIGDRITRNAQASGSK